LKREEVEERREFPPGLEWKGQNRNPGHCPARLVYLFGQTPNLSTIRQVS